LTARTTTAPAVKHERHTAAAGAKEKLPAIVALQDAPAVAPTDVPATPDPQSQTGGVRAPDASTNPAVPAPTTSAPQDSQTPAPPIADQAQPAPSPASAQSAPTADPATGAATAPPAQTPPAGG
jgi:hypothetical protein